MRTELIHLVVLAGFVVLRLSADLDGATPGVPSDEQASLSLFKERILPIFQSPKPSSCVQCHLSAVDLKDYILPSQEDTFVSLRDQGLIDVDKPDESKILKLIGMGERDSDAGAQLIHKSMRDAEYAAFSAWIKASCADPALRGLSARPAAATRPSRPDVVIRHNRKDRVLDSFVRNVWSQRMRCFPCHTPYELDKERPEHAKPEERYRALLDEYGPRMNIFKKSPQETIDYLARPANRVATKDRLPLINVREPDLSLLVLKPTAKVPGKDANGNPIEPSSLMPVTHGGGLKMFVDDPSYKSFIHWIEDYAKVIGDEYATADDLPDDNWVHTNQMVRLKDLPEAWPEGLLVQIQLHGWDETSKQWTKQPVAFTQNSVTPRRLVNGTWVLLRESGPHTPVAPDDSASPNLSAGKYLVKVFTDPTKRAANGRSGLLGTRSFVGSIEVESEWRPGFPDAQWVSAASLSRPAKGN